MTMIRTALPLLLAATLGVTACEGDQPDIEARREAARQMARDNRAVEPIVRDTALPARYRGLETASVEEVAEAIAAIPATSRKIRAAKAIDKVEVLVAPEPIVFGPGARGDLQLDNTASIETIQNAVEGSALAYARVRPRGVVIADIVAARLEDGTLTLYLRAL